MTTTNETPTPAEVTPPEPWTATTPPEQTAATIKTLVSGRSCEQKSTKKTPTSNLTDTDLRYEKNKKDEMFEKIKERLHKTKEDLDKITATLKDLFIKPGHH